MKKILYLALIVLAVMALFTGCYTRTYTNWRNGNRSYNGTNDYGNVSTTPDGRVNGGENIAPMPRVNPRGDMGMNK